MAKEKFRERGCKRMKFFWSEELSCYCAEHNPTIRADKDGNVFGGGSTKVSMPSTPAAPSTAEAVTAWVNAMPQVYETQMKYAPLEAQQQVDLAKQFAQPLGEAYLEAQKAMYPEQYALQSELMTKAKEGMNSDVPDWMRQEYLSNLNANLGTNIGSPIAADYASRGLMQQKQDWQNYYQNMAMSLAGSQPVFNATSPTSTNYMSNFTPTSNMSYMGNNYGNYANAYTSMYNTNAQRAAAGNPYMNALAGVGGTVLGGWAGNGFKIG